MKKGSIFRKLIASYFVFAVSAIVIVVGVSVISVILAVANSNPAFPSCAGDAPLRFCGRASPVPFFKIRKMRMEASEGGLLFVCDAEICGFASFW